MAGKIEKKDVNEAFKTIGKKISTKRKSLRKKFPGISKKLNISVTFLKYIEDGKVDKIPDHVPAKGFVKTYAKLLNVDIEDELNIVERNVVNLDNKPKPDRTRGKRSASSEFFYFILFLFFLIFIFYLVEFNNSRKEKNNESFYGMEKKINMTLDKKLTS